jgi:hypothetical protein
MVGIPTINHFRMVYDIALPTLQHDFAMASGPISLGSRTHLVTSWNLSREGLPLNKKKRVLKSLVMPKTHHGCFNPLLHILRSDLDNLKVPPHDFGNLHILFVVKYPDKVEICCNFRLQ